MRFDYNSGHGKNTVFRIPARWAIFSRLSEDGRTADFTGRSGRVQLQSDPTKRGRITNGGATADYATERDARTCDRWTNRCERDTDRDRNGHDHGNRFYDANGDTEHNDYGYADANLDGDRATNRNGCPDSG